MLKKMLLALLSQLYISGVKIRHTLFNVGLIRGKSFDMPIICIGNITVGGTGKTPMCELLVEHYLKQGGVAILSRGYGRKSKGFREVQITDNYLLVGDEPLQMKRKYPEAVVVVCEKRVEAVRNIIDQYSDVKLVIMDDGFQHRYIKPKINAIMIDYTRPFYEDRPLPLGSLRDTPDELSRADYFVVTKCPKVMTPLDIGLMKKELLAIAERAHVFFTYIENKAPVPIFEDADAEIIFDEDQEVVALAGIGNPTPFVEMVERDYKLVDTLIYADHHCFEHVDIIKMQQCVECYPNAMILTTEKDSVKLKQDDRLPPILRSKLYYSPIKMEFVSGSKSELLKKIDSDVRQK